MLLWIPSKFLSSLRQSLKESILISSTQTLVASCLLFGPLCSAVAYTNGEAVKDCEEINLNVNLPIVLKPKMKETLKLPEKVILLNINEKVLFNCRVGRERSAFNFITSKNYYFDIQV